MIFSSTGLVYLILFFALGLLTYRFFQYWKQKRDTTSKLFFLFALTFLSFVFFRAVSILFFANNIKILVDSIVLVSFIEDLAAAIVAYLIIYSKFPKISPWLGFSIIFILGLFVTIATAGISYQPSFEKMGAIDWGFPLSGAGIFCSILRFGIILITFIPLIVILLQQFKTSEDSSIRKRSFGLSLVLMVAVIGGLADFILNSFLRLDAIYRDITIAILGVLLFIFIFITQKPPAKKEIVSPSPSPKIPW